MFFSSLQLFIKSVALMIEEARFLFESTPPQLVDDVTAHFRRLAEEDTSKLLDRPPVFSSILRVQTRKQALMQKSQVIFQGLFLPNLSSNEVELVNSHLKALNWSPHFYVRLIDGTARIFPNSYAATGNQTHISSIAPLFE